MSLTNFVTPRFYPDFPIPLEEKRRANYDQILDAGLSSYLDTGEALHLDYIDGYHLVTWPPTGLANPFNLLLYVLPDETHKLVDTSDKLPPKTCSSLFDNAFRSVQAIVNVSRRMRNDLELISINQHVGPNEVNDYPFSTTLPQLHLHIHGYDLDVINQYSTLFHSSEEDLPHSENVFCDPFVRVFYELFERRFPEAKIYQPNSAVSILEKEVDSIPDLEERETVTKVIENWKGLWNQVAVCYSDLNEDINGRFIPHSPKKVLKNLEKLYQEFPELSKQSRSLLNWLANNIKKSEDENMWKWFFKGIAGTAGYVFDFKQRARNYVVAPRVKIVPNMGWSLFKNPTHIVRKDRRKSFSKDQFHLAKEIYLEVNRELELLIK